MHGLTAEDPGENTRTLDSLDPKQHLTLEWTTRGSDEGSWQTANEISRGRRRETSREENTRKDKGKELLSPNVIYFTFPRSRIVIIDVTKIKIAQSRRIVQVAI